MTKKTNKKTGSFCDCPCVGATLDKLLQPAILSILVREPLHGYELTRRISGIPGFLDQAPDISGVYRMLKTLESRGMIVAEWDVSEASRAKRLYSITDDGRHCLELWHRTLQKYRQAIDSLLKATKRSLAEVE